MPIYASKLNQHGEEKFRPIMEPLVIMHTAMITLPESETEWRSIAQHYTKEYFWSDREEQLLVGCRKLLQTVPPQALITKRVARFVSYSGGTK